MKTNIHVLALGCLLLSGCGSGAVRDVAVTEPEQRTVVLAGRSLALEGYNGKVVIVGKRDSTVTLAFEKQARGVDEEQARSRLRSITVEEREHGDTYTVRLRSDQPEETSVDVRAEVPYRTPLRLSLDNAVVEIEAMASPVRVQISNGPVRIKGAANDLDVVGGNGDLTVDVVGFRAETDIRLQTNNGSINLKLPSSASAAVEAETRVGTIESTGLTWSEEAETKSTTGSRLQGVLGDGSGRIALRTENGSIVLREGQ